MQEIPIKVMVIYTRFCNDEVFRLGLLQVFPPEAVTRYYTVEKSSRVFFFKATNFINPFATSANYE